MPSPVEITRHHGIAVTRSPLRVRPPDAALEWVRRETGAVRVHTVEALHGGTSSAVHKIIIGLPSGRQEQVVLRRYVLDWVVEEEPWIAVNEAMVLQLLEASTIAAPRLLAADPDGSSTGTPTILMSAVPGRMEFQPRDPGDYLRLLAEQVVRIHAVPVSDHLRTFAPYPAEVSMPPAWSRQPQAWERARDLFEAPPPEVETVFIHRDYHPGNVLWSDGAITGVVDWPSSCAGPAEEDVANCRHDLTRHLGPAAGDEFVKLWLSISGKTDYHPYWDLTNILSKAEDQSDPELDEYAAAAAARL